jgi:hypothetical protein
MSAREVIRRNRFLGVGILAASLFLAVNAGPVPALGQTATGSAASANTQAVQELKATRALLHKADHDYKGNRVKAIHEITKAIHALEGTHSRQHPHHPPAKGGGESQAVSDAQLQKAIQQLQTVQSQLGGGQSSNVTVANAAIGRAIVDLQTALKIK